MSEKQLNFLNIFEPSKHEIENIDEAAIENEEEFETDTETQGVEAKKEELISESLIKREEEIKKEAEIKLKRLRLLQTNDDIPLSEFEDIMPEIKTYALRLSMFRKDYQTLVAGDAKQKAYLILTNPVHDDEEYRDSARLYLKYIKAMKMNQSKDRLDKTSFVGHGYKAKKIKNYRSSYKDAAARNFD